jgi:hypothetical protein
VEIPYLNVTALEHLGADRKTLVAQLVASFSNLKRVKKNIKKTKRMSNDKILLSI